MDCAADFTNTGGFKLAAIGEAIDRLPSCRERVLDGIKAGKKGQTIIFDFDIAPTPQRSKRHSSRQRSCYQFSWRRSFFRTGVVAFFASWPDWRRVLSPDCRGVVVGLRQTWLRSEGPVRRFEQSGRLVAPKRSNGGSVIGRSAVVACDARVVRQRQESRSVSGCTQPDSSPMRSLPVFRMFRGSQIPRKKRADHRPALLCNG